MKTSLAKRKPKRGSAQGLLSSKKWFSWPRAASLVLTTILLLIVYRNLDMDDLWGALSHAHAAWVAMACFMYGLALWSASRRWHVALVVTRQAVCPSATYRVFLVGHFFFVALLGGVAGDLAKCAVYARWFSFAFPEVIASVPLDRLMGMSATGILGATTVLLTFKLEALDQLANIPARFPILWVAAVSVIAIALLTLACFWPSSGGGALGRTVGTLRAGAMKLFVTPKLAGRGLAYALLAQTAWSTVLAVSLLAVAPDPVPWSKMIWTFPVITSLSAVPLTFAGAGVREVAALTLFGMYGIAPSTAIAAALLTLMQKLFWAVIGSMVLWRGDQVQKPSPVLQT